MGLLNGAVAGNKAMPGGRLRTEDGEDIREGSPVGVTNGISHGQEDRHIQGVFLYSDQKWTPERGKQ